MEIEEKTGVQVIFFREQYLWKLQDRVNDFCARGDVEVISVQYVRTWYSHTCMVVCKQKWLAKKPE